MIGGATAAHRLVTRESLVVLLGLVAIAGLAWAHLIHMAASMDAMVMPRVEPWSTAEFVLMFAMWSVMMVAMMLPSAAPMMMVFATVTRRRAAGGRPVPANALFVFAYVVVWIGFSLLATAANWALHQSGLMTGAMGRAVPVAGGVLLVTAGAFQWTPLKHACLNRCRSPLAFLLTEWRDGNRGAFVMGVRHGAYCLLCCWALMSLLFVLGIMNLLWIAALAAIVLAEKVVPGGIWVSRLLGVLLSAWGAWMIAGSIG
jgi:predicted metal-binding membrane protein